MWATRQKMRGKRGKTTGLPLSCSFIYLICGKELSHTLSAKMSSILAVWSCLAVTCFNLGWQSFPQIFTHLASLQWGAVYCILKKYVQNYVRGGDARHYALLKYPVHYIISVLSQLSSEICLAEQKLFKNGLKSVTRLFKTHCCIKA